MSTPTDLQAWVGRTERTEDEVTASAVHRLAATLNRDEPRPRRGDPLPPGWQFLLFPRVVPHAEIGRDGHPRVGDDFLPPTGLPRRMFAGQRTTYHEPLRVGDEATRVSEVISITPKEGRSGRLVFVTVRHSIETERGRAITEEQDFVYREEASASSGASPARPGKTLPTGATWCHEHVVDEVILFRFSALTFNGHRIHYDHPYATGVEGYPGLVMNGGLTTLLVQELLREHAPGCLARIATRNLSPLFGGDRFVVCAEPGETGEPIRIWVASESGTAVLEGTAQAE